MPKKNHTFSENYICPKCRGRKSDIREVALAKTGILDLLPSRDNRYIEVTCALCGYTEFYNRAIYLTSQEKAEETEKLPLPERANGG